MTEKNIRSTPKDKTRFHAAMEIALNVCGYQPEHWLDEYFAWQDYFNGTLGSADNVLDEVQLGIISPRELLKMKNELKRLT